MSITAHAAPSRLPTSGLIAESPPTGELFELARSARSAPDGHFRFVWTLAAGKTGPGEHFHEDERETFEVVSGVLRIWIDGQAKDYAPGDVVTVSPGTRHRFLNPGKEPAVINVALSGPRMEDLLAPVAAATHGRKPRMLELLRMMAGIQRYRPSTPSSAVARGLFSVFFGALRLFGVRPFEPVHGWDQQQAQAARAA